MITLVFIMSISTAAIGENEKEINSPAVNKTASVSGKIVDVKTGESVAGACVSVLGTSIKVYTDLDGNYSIPSLTSGAYTLNVTMISYKVINEIKLNAAAGSKLDKNIVLEPEF